MTSERWAEVKAVFAEAITHGEGRDTFLAARCGRDTQLLDAVRALLESHEGAGDFIETSPVSGLVSDVASLGRHSGKMRGDYRLGRRVATGGMGEVYESWDTRSGTRVAIKVLTDDGLDAARRLKREGLHALEMNHPNICRVHEVSDDDAGAFIAMEFLEGTVLSEATPSEGFDQATVLSLALQLAEAVAHAHERGIVHRDLKCANLMLLPDGTLKVLDFGLARRLSPDVDSEVTAATLTQAGAVAGTLAYLAPEVLRGDRADTRSDVWAFGVVLNELLTGARPFDGRTSFELTSAVLNQEPPALPPSVPAGLRTIRDNCLGKMRHERYRNGTEVLAALRTFKFGGRVSRLRRRSRSMLVVAAATITVLSSLTIVWMMNGSQQSGQRQLTSIAILPFQETVSADEAQRYFADGITEALITKLGTIDSLRVISRATVARYDSRTPVDQLRKDLQVNLTVTGGIEREAGRVRVTAALNDTTTGSVLWRQQFDRSANEVLALEADVVQAIVDRLGVRLSPAQRTNLRLVRAVDPVVYEAYLKGRFHWNKRTPESLEQAVGFYKSALQTDPTYAPAHAALADCYNQMGTVLVGKASPSMMRPLAKASAVAALQLDDSLAEAHATLGYVSHYDWDWATAEKEFRRALELNPNLALGHLWYANLLMSRKRFNEAIAEVRRAEALDPFSLIVLTNVGWVLSYAGHHDEAVAVLRHALDLDPKYVQAHVRLADAFSFSGRHDEAFAEHQVIIQLTGRSRSSVVRLAEAYGLAGRRSEALAIFDEALKIPGGQYISPVTMYVTYFMLGEFDKGFEWIERALLERSNGIVYLASDPIFDPIRTDPRFQRVLTQIGLADVR